MNVTRRGVDPEEFADAALNFIHASVRGQPGRARGQIDRLANSVRTGGLSEDQARERLHPRAGPLPPVPSAHLEYAYSIPTASYAGPVSTSGFAALMISRRRDEAVIEVLEKHLGISHESHGDDLNAFRSQHPGIYPLIVAAKLGSAMEAAKCAGSSTLIGRTAALVTQHALHLAVATAHIRIALLRSYAREPLGGGFAGRKEWLNMGHVCTSTLIEPARAVHNLLDLEIPAGATDDEAISLATAAGALPADGSAGAVVSTARRVREQLPARFKHDNAWIYVPHVAALVQKHVRPLAGLGVADLKAAKWTKQSFCEQRLGVSASEGAVIVAMNLLLAGERIDACVVAKRAEKPLPTFPDAPAANSLATNALARITEALRVEGQPDRHSLREVGDPDNHTSRQLVLKVRGKVAAGGVGDALQHLRIDPSVWFRR
ncbi:hypothetical protein E2493_16695 [Sphingomonas parva]|uniref:Uncharacterized protein n=1 Tax=Sphingomonas parva TaxID=2555898 RepID=A0A4Y8ZRW9_9SPHN|nr:hypothetical protein [Sphingomonas parva]TFI57146.1 hypothetical protein E2493_16695 [Sphingomonas parva]